MEDCGSGSCRRRAARRRVQQRRERQRRQRQRAGDADDLAQLRHRAERHRPENLAKAFHKLHPNITVNVVSQPASNYFALLQAKAISKNGPDLAVMWTGLFTLQYKGFLQNLKGLVPASALARIDPDALKWTSNSFNAANGPYVIPLENQFYIGFYNKADFAKAGVTSVPTDWSQLYAACTKLKQAGYTPLVYGNGGQPLGATFYPWYDMSYMMIGAYSVSQWQSLYSGSTPWTSPADQRPADELDQAAQLRLHQLRRRDQHQQPRPVRVRQGRHDGRRHLGHRRSSPTRWAARSRRSCRRSRTPRSRASSTSPVTACR